MTQYCQGAPSKINRVSMNRKKTLGQIQRTSKFAHPAHDDEQQQEAAAPLLQQQYSNAQSSSSSSGSSSTLYACKVDFSIA